LIVLLAPSSALAQLRTISIGPTSRPESIVKAWHGKYYVSLQNSGTVPLDDGEIRKVDIETGVVTPFVAGMENPRGLAFTGKYLVAADTTRIWIVDEHGNKRVLADAAHFPPSSFAPRFFNDAAPARGGRAVYVTEMGRRDIIRDASGFLLPTDSPLAAAIEAQSRIYKINLDGRITSLFEPSLKLLVMNGVTESKCHDKRLLALDFFTGSIVEVDLARDQRNIIATGPFRGADGIEQAHDGTIFVSSFENGAVWRVSKDGEEVKVLIKDVGHQSTADLTLDEDAGLLYVPDTLHGTIIVLPTE
jgi:sugar lactone lactonase YvrE